MSARNIVRGATTLIINQIQANIARALADTKIDQGDNQVSTEVPPSQSYFNYAGAKGYRAPAVFVVPDAVDFKLERGQNFVDATIHFLISVVIEERTEDRISLKAWMYQDALHEILQGVELNNSRLKCVILVRRARFSANNSEKSDGAEVFRKEVALDCEVEVYEQL